MTSPSPNSTTISKSRHLLASYTIFMRYYSVQYITAPIATYFLKLIIYLLFLKSIADDSNPISLCRFDTITKFSFSEFIHPPNQLETIKFIFHMIDVVKQKNEQFKNILSLMRNGTSTNEKCEFLINRFLSKVNKKKKTCF